MAYLHIYQQTYLTYFYIPNNCWLLTWWIHAHRADIFIGCSRHFIHDTICMLPAQTNCTLDITCNVP